MSPELFRHRVQNIAMATLRRDRRLDMRDIRRVLSVPGEVHHNNLGLALAELSRKQYIAPLGHARSDWPRGNSHHLTVWELGPNATEWVEADETETELPEIQGELF